MPRNESTHGNNDHGKLDAMEDKMLRVGEDYSEEFFDLTDYHHYEDVYNYIVDRYYKLLLIEIFFPNI